MRRPAAPDGGDRAAGLSAMNDFPIQRRTVSVDGRDVHFRLAGRGPLVALLHESPRSSVALLPLLRMLAARFTVLAFDTPGYGLSDPLPLAQPEAEDYADALAATLAALGVARCGVYGTHTGAVVALAFALRYPERTTALALDGLPCFTPQERREALDHYLPAFEPAWSGAHLAWLWSRVRDQFTYFPWYERRAERRLSRGGASLARHQEVVLDILSAGSGYRTAYAAAFRFDSAAALAGAARLPCPVTCLARSDDLLFGHLDRIAATAPGVALRRLDGDRAAWGAAVAEALAVCRAPAPALRGAGARLTFGGSLMVRRLGAGRGRPLVLLHAHPWSSTSELAAAERMLAARGASGGPVLLPDLPGSGQSAPLEPRDATRAGDLAHALLTALECEEFDLAGRFTGAVVAAEMARQAPRRVATLRLLNPPPGGAALQRLCDDYPCETRPAWSGGHLLAAWHRARDARLHAPWFDRRPEARGESGEAPAVAELARDALAVLQQAPGAAALCGALLRESPGLNREVGRQGRSLDRRPTEAGP